MKTRARCTRMLLCAFLLLSCLLVMSVREIPAGPGFDRYLVTTTSATSSTEAVTTTAATTTVTTPDCQVIPGSSIPCKVIPVVTLSLVIFICALFVCALVLRSRWLRVLDELDGQRRLVHELRTQPGIAAPATGMSASSALKRLLELGVLQPKEYMEKKMLAERIEKKMSAKQLMDEGLISQEQYDALTRKQGVEE